MFTGARLSLYALAASLVLQTAIPTSDAQSQRPNGAKIECSEGDQLMPSATILFEALGAIATACLVVLTYLSVKAARHVEWFTGAMERHSDQQRQIAAHKAGIKMIWWDKTMDVAHGYFPHEGAHGEENVLKVIYIGIPPERRKKQPSGWQKFLGER